MKKAVTDRRTQKTQHSLHQALLELILEKGYEAITVQDIIDRANVGRSTFYAHFWDKEDALLSGLEKLQTEFESQRTNQSADNQAFYLSRWLFEHTQKYSSLYKALVGKKGNEGIIKKFHDGFAKYLAAEVRKLSPNEQHRNIPEAVLEQNVINSLLGLMIWWLENDMPYPPAQMDAYFQQTSIQPFFKTALD